jgi:hypothetical protein
VEQVAEMNRSVTAILAILLVFLTPAIAIGQSSKTRTFDSYKLNFSVTLPEGWTPFSEDELSELNTAIARYFRTGVNPQSIMPFSTRTLKVLPFHLLSG